MSTKKETRPKARITAADLAQEGNRLRDLGKTVLGGVRGGSESPDLKYKYKYV
jgi:hypothetical protein